MGSGCFKCDLKLIRLDKDVSVFSLVQNDKKENTKNKDNEVVNDKIELIDDNILNIIKDNEIIIDNIEKINDNNQNDFLLPPKTHLFESLIIKYNKSDNEILELNLDNEKENSVSKEKENENKNLKIDIFIEENIINKNENQNQNQKDNLKHNEFDSKNDEFWLDKYNKFIKRTNFRSLSRPTLSSFEFTRKIVEEINLARLDFKKYSKKIDTYQKLIKTNKLTKRKFLPNQEGDIYLPKGEKGFEDCSNYLKKRYKEMKFKDEYPKKLTYLNELKFPLLKHEINFNQMYIETSIKNLRKKYKGIYDIINFFVSFKSLSDPEISTMLQIVDEETREILLKNTTRYIGVSHGKMKDGTYIVYLLLAN
jgi:hypothetical protein